MMITMLLQGDEVPYNILASFIFWTAYLNTRLLLYLERGARPGSLHGNDVSGGNHLSVEVPEVNLDITRVQAARYHACVVKAIHFVSRQDLVV